MRTVYLIALLLTVGAAPAAPFAAVPYQDRPVTAKVAPYTVRPDLGNISNRALLPKLTEAQRKALVTNAFVARPTREEQLFYLYEQNNYRNIPSFVTTDSVLHTWHVFYDFTLRWLEQECLLPVVQQLSQGMFDSTAAALKDEHPAEITAALERNLAFFAVPLALLEQRPKLPPTVAALVDRELQKIAAHEKRDQAVTGAVVDYTQFIPRGHYTRSEGLQRFFKAMLWYGLVPLDLKSSPATLQALLITSRLIGNDDLKALWEQLYEPTTFYVGRSDDLTWLDYAPLLVRVFGSGDIDRFADEEKLAAFRALAEKELPGPRIANEMLIDGKEVTQGRQFRLLGQRYIPDSQVLQDLSYPKVGTQAEPRHLPMGLDVFAVLGSQRAAELLDKVYEQPKFANYLEQRQKLTEQFAALSPVDWQQNLYHGWLYVLQPLLSPASAGYPAFMRNLAWRDKSLITSLASWTQLRHDTILYGKQSVAEAGGDEPPPPPGYVEPQPLLYERLTWLLRTARQGLLDRGFLTEPKDDNDEEHPALGGFNRFIELTETLATISRKELNGVPLTVDELERIKWYGSSLEWLMLSMARLTEQETTPRTWWEIESRTDRNMALVADVHTSFDSALQEGVGQPAELWVIVPFKNRLVATRGAMFTWYEFLHPAADRLTDEVWQGKLAKGEAPPMAPWAARVVIPPGLTTPSQPTAD